LFRCFLLSNGIFLNSCCLNLHGIALNGTYNIQKDLDLSVGIDNVLNKNYAEHLNKLGSSGFDYAATEQFNNIGRNYWARISMKF